VHHGRLVVGPAQIDAGLALQGRAVVPGVDHRAPGFGRLSAPTIY
jgi:hypothetical protein